MQSKLSSEETTQSYQKDEIDFIEFFLLIVERWKLILLITFIGIGLSLGLASFKTKVYQVSVDLSRPSLADISSLNNNGLTQYEPDEVFKLFYDYSTSKVSFNAFIDESQILPEFFPNVDEASLDAEKQRYFTSLFSMMENDIRIPNKRDVNLLNDGTRFSITFSHRNELLAVDFLNQYLPFVNTKIVKQLEKNEEILVAGKKEQINQKITMLREVYKQQRLFEIERLIEGNAEKLEQLRLKKQLLVTNATSRRQTEIEILQEANQLKLNKLQQKRQLLILKAEKDRSTKIAEAQEAHKIALALNIVYPTSLDELKEGDSIPTTTKINVNGDESLPLYLMGTKYLETLVKTLKERDNDSKYLEELNALDLEIETVKNDQVLAQMKERSAADDAKFIQELNDINVQIIEIENDERLQILRDRQTDDPFIPELASLLNELNELNALSLDFSDVSLYAVESPPFASGRYKKPSKALIVIIGSFISFVMALVLVLFKLVIERRVKQKKQLDRNLG
ncbi:hypothetical protein KUL42_18440 [Alteromonas sp. KUL42]|uniref:Wzz/FepE/Etk N-terminal domain-containing protein n=1 Tax=Alteromonas sp. KUL42 TaxID=2480797 RepID=UPI0010365CF4|nr:Wzz/FepE/Etk N-terminal domain-containing protein [Alteromonas sp. KUL42]TAP35603.1 hypothetical protein EYR97_09080 [Alteromonas sp. KUL42]GEA07083.1 hypothetical protein KUL42_18440 [Alteromonas sp. KUL42]